MIGDIGIHSSFFKKLYENALSFHISNEHMKQSDIKNTYNYSKKKRVEITISYIQVMVSWNE